MAAKCHQRSFKVKKDGIEIADFPVTGRGIKATTDLEDGQLILTVKDVVTVEKIIEAEFDGQLKLTSNAKNPIEDHRTST